MRLSVLVPIYYKENPQHVAECFDSLARQIRRADEIVLVEDGPLTAELYEVIDHIAATMPELRRVQLPEHTELGHVLAVGIEHCTGELVARMDSDDISHPERFAIEEEYLMQHPDISVVGSWVDEFVEHPDQIISTRCVPENHADILKFAHYRNPINHPSAMFRRQDVIETGNYQTFFYFEDYALWCRMLLQGKKFHNLQQSLLSFRSGYDMFDRRGGWNYIESELKFQKFLFHTGFCRIDQFLLNVFLRTTTRILPIRLRHWVYTTFLRRHRNS